jgi:hypothetical protein
MKQTVSGPSVPTKGDSSLATAEQVLTSPFRRARVLQETQLHPRHLTVYTCTAVYVTGLYVPRAPVKFQTKIADALSTHFAGF